MTTELTFYKTRDNAEDMVLLADDAAVDTTSLTRVAIKVGATTIDSQSAPAAFEWPLTLQYKGAAVKGLRLKLGGQAIAAGRYAKCRLTVYDAAHPNGLVWANDLVVTMLD